MSDVNDAVFAILDDLGSDTEEALECLMGDKKAYASFLMQFPKKDNIVRLKKAVDAKDYKEASFQVHALKGVALNLSLLPFADLCIDALLLYRAGKNEEAAAVTPEIIASFETFSRIIGKLKI